MSFPVPERAAVRRAAVPAVFLAAALAIWLALPDKTYVFDGVMFSGIVERAADEWRRELWNRRHFLFNPFFLVLRDALGYLGISVGAYRLFQTVNALMGGAGLCLFADLARRLSRDTALGWCAAGALGATWCYGTRATEGQVYMLMSVGAIAVFWAAVRLLERPTPARAIALGLCAVVAALFHAANVFLFPAVLAAFWFAFPSRRRLALAAFAALVVSITIPYVVAFGGGGLRDFFSVTVDFHDRGGRGFWAGLAGKFLGDAQTSAAGRLIALWRETGAALVPMSEASAATAGLVLWLTAAGALAGAWRGLRAREREAAAVIALAWGGWSVVNVFWPGGLFFYVPPLACAFALLSLAAGPRWAALALPSRRVILGAAVAAIAAGGAWNVRAGLLPQSRLESNVGYRQALFVRDHTEAASWILITGLGIQNAKVYLPNFAHRTREVLEYYFERWPKDEAVSRFAQFVADKAENGVPLYLLSDLVEDKGVLEQMTKRWGVEASDLTKALGPGRLILTAASPDLRVYLFVPREHPGELFAGLAFSVLNQADPVLLEESVADLKEIASGMTPSQRRRAGEILKTTNWGYDLLWKGFAPHMSPESMRAAQVRAQRFAERRKSADFWLRAGNLYEILGLKAEALAAWTKAQALSGDAGLLKKIRSMK